MGAQGATVRIQNLLHNVNAVARVSAFRTRMRIAMEKAVRLLAASRTQRSRLLQKQMHLWAGAQVVTVRIQNLLHSVNAVARISVFRTHMKIAMENGVLLLAASLSRRT